MCAVDEVIDTRYSWPALAMRPNRYHLDACSSEAPNLRGAWLRCCLAVLWCLTAAGQVDASEVAAGTSLEVRLNAPLSSRTSHRGDRVEATVIAPAVDGTRIPIPQGSTLAGHVGLVHKLGFGIKHSTASITLQFESLTVPGGKPVPISARVVEVETARERVNGSGVIGGIHPVANFSSGVSIFISALMTQPAIAVPILAGKFLIARSPDPEIRFPAGTELIVQLTSARSVPASFHSEQELSPISSADAARARQLLRDLPEQQSRQGLHGQSDLTNILFFGTQEQIGRAFHAAGWAGSQGHNALALYHIYNCLVMRFGYSMAPMTRLMLNGVRPQAMYQKSLNTFAKRHHIRLWKQDQPDTWLSAASEDLSFSMKKGLVTHASDRNIDNERAKVIDDLVLTGCVESASLLPRNNLRLEMVDKQAIVTDGRIAVMRLTDCFHPAHEFPAPERHAIASRFGHGMGIVAKDFVRSNPLTLLFAASNMLICKADLPQTVQNQASQPGHHAPVNVVPVVWKRAVAINNFSEPATYTSSTQTPSTQVTATRVSSTP